MAGDIQLGEQIVVCQPWEWSSSIIEPDGVSLHPDEESVQRFIRTYWDGMPDRLPPKYSRPGGQMYPLGVSEAVMEAVLKSGEGIRFIEVDFPGKEGDNQLEQTNTPWSVKPGLRATLTQEGFEQARQDAGESLDVGQFVTDNSGDLVVITLPQGSYHTVGGVRFMVEASFDENGILKDDARDGNAFDVRYEGTVLIEGLEAGERWLNWSYNPDGSPST